jgi:4-aminobutyrate aminotransferase-like enzyme/Ser/Thr protein kinase RdoA (MazF antagonist)
MKITGRAYDSQGASAMVAIKHEAPAFTAEEARRIAAEVFGVSAGAVEALPGEHDANFLLRTDGGEPLVLKLSHAGEERAVLEMQAAALEQLAVRAPELALPRVRPAPDGARIATAAGADGSEHLARLLTYVPGKLLAETRSHTPELLRSLGAALGTLDRALLDFDHPAAARELKWDLARAGWIRGYLGYITDTKRRALVERFLALFEADALPRLAGLRQSVIYHDANDYNVIVGRDSTTGERRVTGVIDFGDMLRTATVAELAIACAYAMLGKTDPLAAAAHVAAGYHAALPLTDDELAALYPLILARLCVSVVNSAYQRAVDPANAYLQVSDAPAWALLECLADVHPRLAHYTLRAACELPAVPSAPAVEAWLRAHRGAIGRLVGPDLGVEPLVVFDLSIGSADLGNVPDFAETEPFTHTLWEQLRAAGAHVGIGCYDEARPIYTTDAYRVEGNDGPEWRALHVGLDIFQEPGSPVYAPLDGIVHSFADNAAPRDYGPTIILEHTVADGTLTFYTLYGHLSRGSLDGLRAGMPVARGMEIARIGGADVNGGWPPHLHFQIITDLLGKHGDFPGVARPSQRALWLSLSPDPNLIAGIPDEKLAREVIDRMDAGAILAAREQHIGPNLSVAYRRPLHIVRGYMQYLYDADGRRYLDAVNNVPHVGHSHPRVVRAGQRQMAVLNTNTRYLHEQMARYAARLAATLPEPLRVVYFVCSGSEANELALRLSWAHTGRRGTVVMDVAYHGNTTTLVDISPYKHAGPGGTGAADFVRTVPLPYVYRGPYRGADAGVRYAGHVAEAIEGIQQDGVGVAAFIAESLPGCGGQILPPDGYLAAAYASVRAAGGVCIADEVQTGFGRVGTHFWAFEAQGVVPDIVTMGKPIGNGHPLGAVVTTPEIAASFDNGMEYFNTFGGNPVSCAIGMAVLDVIEEEGLQVYALRTGTHLIDGLRALMERHPVIGDVRGQGLFIGVELVRDRATREPAGAQAAYVANRMRERGILLSTDGPDHNVLKIKPPLAFTTEDADFLVTTLDDVLTEDDAQP